MKVVITGHTYGVGQALWEFFYQRAEVKGLSRSNGFDIDRDFDRVVEEIKGCDLFINNAYRDQQQTKLLMAVKDYVPNIVVMGSVSRFYPELIPTQYVHDKQELAEACRLISIDPNGPNVLHLDLSFIENTQPDKNDPQAFNSDWTISYDDIIGAVNFWLNNTSIRQMEFTWKLTPHVYRELKRINPGLDPSRITF